MSVDRRSSRSSHWPESCLSLLITDWHALYRRDTAASASLPTHRPFGPPPTKRPPQGSLACPALVSPPKPCRVCVPYISWFFPSSSSSSSIFFFLYITLSPPRFLPSSSFPRGWSWSCKKGRNHPGARNCHLPAHPDRKGRRCGATGPDRAFPVVARCCPSIWLRPFVAQAGAAQASTQLLLELAARRRRPRPLDRHPLAARSSGPALPTGPTPPYCSVIQALSANQGPCTCPLDRPRQHISAQPEKFLGLQFTIAFCCQQSHPPTHHIFVTTNLSFAPTLSPPFPFAAAPSDILCLYGMFLTSGGKRRRVFGSNLSGFV